MKSETPSETNDEVEHIRRATDHLQIANDILEGQGGGTSYVGEEHMMAALVQIRNLAKAREADNE